MNLTAVFRIRDQGSSRLRRITQMMDRMNRTTRSATQSSNLYRDANGRLHDSMGRFVSETSRATNATSSLATRVNGLRVGTNGLSASLGGTQTALLGIASAFLTASGLASGFSNFTQAADSYSNINARLANINDGLQTQSQLQDKIFKASRRSRSSYDEMASSVAKLNLLAKDAFSSNDEAIRFTELMTKSFSVSGAGQQEMESGMYQLTQAMASGKLQGDEFRSIMENAPLLAQAISKTAGVSMGALKEMSSEGTITADLIKRSLFNAADEIEEKFGNMPMTFSQAVTVFKSSAKRVFEPLFDQFIGFVNSKTFEKLENKAHSFVKIAANGLSKVFSIVKSLYQVWQTIGPSVIKVAKVIGTFALVAGSILAVVGIVKLVGMALAFVASPIGLIAAGITGLIFGFKTLYDNSETFRGIIDSIVGKVKTLWSAFKTGGAGGLVDAIFGKGTSNTLKSKFDEIKAYIAEKVTQFKPIFENLKTAFSQAWSTVSDILSNAWSIIEPILSGLWSNIQTVGDIGAIVFNNVISPAISFLVQLFSTLWSIAKPILTILSLGFEALSAVIKWAWDNVLAPLVDFILTGVKNAFDNFSGALAIVQGWFETLSGWISTAYDHVKDFIGFISSAKLPSWISNGISAGVNFVGDLIGAGDGKKGGKKSHYSGLDSVPYDGYSARLHKGERVLTAQENKDYSQGNGGGITIAKLADSIVIREEADIDKFAYKLAKAIEREMVQVS
ncbi:tape measure protein [Lysinibacillus fusiformis]|uniref:tape measure protein n=1 Tax=Lysinibacillus fusiformis TaxID=28031 RepID=UPI002EA3311D|nr:tape measure protein [Lysinibacillus fusiformis]